MLTVAVCDFVFKCFINNNNNYYYYYSLTRSGRNVQMASLWSRGKTARPLPETPLSSALWQTPIWVVQPERRAQHRRRRHYERRRHANLHNPFSSQLSTRWYANQATLSFLTELAGSQEGFRTRYFLGRPSKTDLTLPLRPTSCFVPTRF